VQHWTGTNGVRESYAEGKLVQRFLKIDKMSTVSDATAPFWSEVRSGYGYVDENLNFTVDPGEQKRYFEVRVATNTIFSRMTTNRQLPALHAYHRHCSRTRCSHLLFPLWQARLGDPSTSLRCAMRGPEVNCSPAGSLFSPVRARRNQLEHTASLPVGNASR